MDEVPIPGLKQKVEFARQVLPMREAWKPREKTERAFREMLWRAAGLKITSATALERKWERCRRLDRSPPEVIEGLCLLFPSLTPELITCSLPKFRECFRKRRKEFTKARQTAEQYLRNRIDLTSAIRPYYKHVDPDPQFPLLYREGWIIGEPLELTRENEQKLLCWQDKAPPIVPRPLAGLELKWHEMLLRVSPNLKLRGGYSYRLIDVKPSDGSLVLTFCPGDYFEFMDTCEILGYEATEQITAGANIAQLAKIGLPLRGAPASIFDLKNRSAVVGISTLFVELNNPKGHVFFYHTRSSAVGEAPDTLAAVPSGTFEPHTANDAWHSRDFSLRRNILRELGEELLGQKKLNEYDTRGDDFMDDRSMRTFGELLESRKARLYFLGIGLDPITTKPECLTCLVVNRRDILQRIQHRELVDNFEGWARPAELTSGQLELMSRHARMISTGAACMRLAARHLSTLLRPFQ